MQCISEKSRESSVDPFEVAVAIHNDDCILCLARHDGEFFKLLVDAFELLRLLVDLRLLLVELQILSAECDIGACTCPYRPDDEGDEEYYDGNEDNHADELRLLFVLSGVLSLEFGFLSANPLCTFFKVFITFLKLLVGFVHLFLLLVNLRLLLLKLLLDEGEFRLLSVHLSHKNCSMSLLIVDFFLFGFQFLSKCDVFILELLILPNLFVEFCFAFFNGICLHCQSSLFCL